MKIILHHNLRDPLPGILKLTQYHIYLCAHVIEIKYKNYMGMPIDINKSECIFLNQTSKALVNLGCTQELASSFAWAMWESCPW